MGEEGATWLWGWGLGENRGRLVHSGEKEEPSDRNSGKRRKENNGRKGEL